MLPVSGSVLLDWQEAGVHAEVAPHHLLLPHHRDGGHCRPQGLQISGSQAVTRGRGLGYPMEAPRQRHLANIVVSPSSIPGVCRGVISAVI